MFQEVSENYEIDWACSLNTKNKKRESSFLIQFEGTLKILGSFPAVKWPKLVVGLSATNEDY